MNNTVVLYKVPWTSSSLNQPYFISDIARDSYLNNLENIKVLENVNIHLEPKLFLELIIPIDITEAENYNFAKIIYNGKNYFATVSDYEQISVDRTKLYLERHSLSEYTNFLNLFQQYKINKCTLNDYSYGKEANIQKQEFRVKEKLLLGNTDFYIRLAWEYLNENYDSSTRFFNFYILYLDNGAFNASSENAEFFNITVFGEKTQYKVLFIPEDSTNIYYKRYQPDEMGGGTYELDKFTFTVSSKILDALSPYIKAVFYTALPCGKYEDNKYVLPNGFTLYPFSNEISGKINNSDGVIFQAALDTDYYYIEYQVDDIKKLFTQLKFRFYSVDNEIIINIYDFINKTGKITFRYNYIFNINGTQCIGYISSNALDSVKNSRIKWFQIPLGDSTTYLLDSESLFEAENKYYQALTRNTIKQNTISGGVQSSVQIASGVVQGIGAGISGQVGGMSEGIANTLRGIGTIADTVNKNAAYSQQRSLMAKQEKAKPDEVQRGLSAAAEIYSQGGSVTIIEEVPFDEDYNDFLANLHYYGVETYLFRESIDISEFEYDGHFFIQSIAIIKNNVFIERQIYDDLYSLLSNGCRYFIVDGT